MRGKVLIVGAVAAVALIVAPGAQAAFSDNFNSYADGDMQTTANPPWALTSVDSAENVVQIVSGTVVVDQGLDRTAGGQNRDVSVVVSEAGPILTAQIDIMRGGATGDGNIYSVEFNDSVGNNLARWFGRQDNFQPRIGGTVLAGTLLPDDNFHTLKAVINTATNITEFFFDNVSQGTLAHSAAVSADTVSQILIRATTRVDFGPPEQKIILDNVSLVPEPATVGLLALGGLCLVRRRRA